jgi:hypothetical protein
MRSPNLAIPSAIISSALLLAACAGTDLTPIASFGASNALSPSGYSETKISDTQYQVKATGTEATPKARIEKIARARAAQIGVEEKLKYYKVTSVQFGVLCDKKHEFYKGGATASGARQTVLVDVVYAKEPLDASYLSTKDSFATLNGELDSETIPTDQKASAEQESRAACGQAT